MYPEANVRGGSNRNANTSREMAQKGRDTDGERMRDPQGSGSGPGLPTPASRPWEPRMGWDGMDGMGWDGQTQRHGQTSRTCYSQKTWPVSLCTGSKRGTAEESTEEAVLPFRVMLWLEVIVAH